MEDGHRAFLHYYLFASARMHQTIVMGVMV